MDAMIKNLKFMQHKASTTYTNYVLKKEGKWLIHQFIDKDIELEYI
jgi:hypothetical protein